MSKIIKKILSSLEGNLDEANLNEEDVTLSLMVYTADGGATKSGHLRLNLKDVLDAINLIDKRVTKVRRLEKLVEGLKKNGRKERSR